MKSNLNKLLCVFLFTNQLFGQIPSYEKIAGCQIVYGMEAGKLNGGFQAYAVSSGENILFVDGKLENGKRVGVWTIYDTLNPKKILIQREYSSPNRFKQLVPNYESNKLVAFISYNLNRIPELDTNGCRSYVYVSENDFIYGKRIYREIPLSENPQLPLDLLNSMLKESCSKSVLFKYGNDRFTEVLNENPFDKLNGEILAYRIKEDFFFDKNQLISEHRIIGIAPVYKDLKTGEIKELCWFYYPQLRKYLKEIIMMQQTNQSNLENELLIRNFTSVVYKTMENARIENNIKPNEFITDFECLMAEHNLWLFFAGYGEWPLY